MFSQNVLNSAAFEMDSLIYGEQHPNVVNYLRNQFSNISETLAAPARAFMEKGRDIFELFNSSEAMRLARSVVQAAMGKTEVEIQCIKSIFELEQFQNASVTMQRWLMANPNVREIYHDQRCDGYSSSYFDNESDAIGKDHYDYKMVMDGVMEIEEDDWKITQFMEQLKEGDRELLLEEKADIIHCWNTMDVLMALGQDPTNSEGGML